MNYVNSNLTVTLSDCSHLAHVIVLCQIHKFMCYCTVFSLYYLEFEGNFQVQSPRAYIWEDDLTTGFLHYKFGGVYLYLEGRIHGGAYFRNFAVVMERFQTV